PLVRRRCNRPGVEVGGHRPPAAGHRPAVCGAIAPVAGRSGRPDAKQTIERWRHMTCFAANLLAMSLALLADGAGPSGLSPREVPDSALETAVGVQGVYYARTGGENLAARPLDERSPIVLQVAGGVRDGNSTVYELRYIGSRPGRYDLRDY